MIKVFNSKNEGGEVVVKEEFLESLQGLRFVKLNNKAHYETGALKYTVTLGEDKLSVYEEFVVVKDELYIVSKGSFGFLKDVEVLLEWPWL